MNNIAILARCLLCTLIFSTSSYAENHSETQFSQTCKEFRDVLEKPDGTASSKKDAIYKKGVLWKVESNEGNVNYLFGTMHSQDYAVSEIPPPVRLAVVKSKTLFMETIPNEEANQAFLNMMYFKDKQRLDSLLEPELLEELTTIIQGYGIEKENVNFVKPWAAFSLIGRPKPVRAPTLETKLLELAQRSMREVKSMETMEEILSALDGLAIEDQAVILKDTICNHGQIIRNTKKLVNLYLLRDLQGIVDFNNQPHHDEAVFQRFIQRILYDRNKRMLAKIEPEFKMGGVFVAVGASHLAEENGLLNELQKKSYKITPIY